MTFGGEDGRQLTALKASPNDVPCADIFAHAIRTNNLRFAVRELKGRVGNYYSR